MSTKITTPELFNLSSNNTAATQLPVFTTSTRPTPTASTLTVDYLVVAGGGAGGHSYGASGSGGGAGEFLYKTSQTLTTRSSGYSVIVGAGSLAVTGTGQSPDYASNGGDSTFNLDVTNGGGGGANSNNYNAGASGGSGSGGVLGTVGGTSVKTASGLGNNGGYGSSSALAYGSGGGGGALTAGANGSGSVGGNGGDGETNSITGTPVVYSAGGGGGRYTTYSSNAQGGSGGIGGNPISGIPATPTNYGCGGAGGSYAPGGIAKQGGNASSGVVILRYPTNSSPVIKTTGSLVYTESIDSSDTVIQFTEGSGNVSFASAGITVGEMIFNSTTEKVEYWDGFQWNMIKDEEQIDPTKDLILYLDANDPASGISNTSWVDVSANNYSLTSNGTPVLGGTSPQKEYDIASGDYFGLPNTAPPFGNTNGVIAVECWVKLKANNSRAYWFSTSSTTNKNDYFYIGWLADLGNVYIAYRNGTTSDEYFELGALSGNTSWQHIFCQLNGSTKEIWINGVQQSTTPSGTGLSSGWVDYVSYATATSTNIGILRKATIGYGNADYGQIRYWSASKTQAEIIAFFNQRATDFGKTPIT